MSCQNFFKNNMDAFEKATCVFSSRQPMVIFILNRLFNIKDFRDRFCICKKDFSCLPCQFGMVYLNNDYDIYENSFNLQFLFVFHLHLYENLKRLLVEVESHLACKFINKKYFYVCKDFFDGRIERFHLSNCLEDYENKKINYIKKKKKDLKINFR